MFSKTCEYAIRAMLYIAQCSAKSLKTGIHDIAENVNAPEPFIAKILQDLVKKGLLSSVKGPGGGFYLDDAGLKRSLAEVVTAVDGDKIFSGCGLGLTYCSDAQPCPIHPRFKKLRQEIYDMLSSATLGEFHQQLDSREAFLKHI